jgi:hypothetical protein
MQMDAKTQEIIKYYTDAIEVLDFKRALLEQSLSSKDYIPYDIFIHFVNHLFGDTKVLSDSYDRLIKNEYNTFTDTLEKITLLSNTKREIYKGDNIRTLIIKLAVCHHDAAGRCKTIISCITDHENNVSLPKHPDSGKTVRLKITEDDPEHLNGKAFTIADYAFNIPINKQRHQALKKFTKRIDMLPYAHDKTSLILGTVNGRECFVLSHELENID